MYVAQGKYPKSYKCVCICSKLCFQQTLFLYMIDVVLQQCTVNSKYNIDRSLFDTHSQSTQCHTKDTNDQH